SWQHWTLQESSLSTGTFVYDLGAATGWSGGHSFKVEFIVEGGSGEYIEVEYAKIVSVLPTPTYTTTPVYTDTPIATYTPGESATYTATPEDTPAFTATPTMTESAEDTPTPTPTPLYPQDVWVWPEFSIIMQPGQTQNIFAVSGYHKIPQPDVPLRYAVLRGSGTFGGATLTCAATGSGGEPAGAAFTAASQNWDLNIIRVDNMGLGGQRFLPIIVIPGKARGKLYDKIKGAAATQAGEDALAAYAFKTEAEAKLFGEEILVEEREEDGVTGAFGSHCSPITTTTPTPTATSSFTSTSTITPTPVVQQPTHTFTPTCTSTVVSSADELVSRQKVVPYPNPACGQVHFAYKLNGPASITIDVFRLTGERVATIGEHKNGDGQIITTTWDAAGVAPGVYFCRIMIKNEQGRIILDQTRKVALVK
ncbi:T9SS type A sorting domain-containing protein, partial [candidate division FCPU426 bacterium]|nr:T9SS type A sorting domain-containing protein [candidate division FCPU426 bacterium]